jgi:hypothetical protein
MKRNRKHMFLGLCAIVCFCLLSATALFAADEMTIMGKVTDEGLVSDDGQVYGISDDEKGKELMENVGKKVEATGTVMESEGKKILTIKSFKVSEE